MGSIAKLEDKPRSKCRKWRLFVSKGAVDGKRVQRSRRFDGTYTEAKAALARFEAESGNAKATVYSTMTFREYANVWLASKEGTVQASTMQTKRRIVATLCHVIGDAKMLEVSPKDVEDAYARLMRGDSPSGRPLKPSHVYQLSIALWSIFNDASERGAIPSNPVASAKRPKCRREEKEPPTASDVAKLIESLDMADGRCACAMLCATMGLRKGEALALSWGDVDGDVLHVRKSMRQPTIIVQTKTGAGRRDLPIPPYVHELLEQRKAAQMEQFADSRAAGLMPDVDDWSEIPIASNAMGARITSEAMGAWWTVNRKKYGISCGLHGLRHAYLTTAAVNGVPPRVMQALAGHESPITTMKIYAHANMGAKEDAARIIASAMHPNA